MYLLIIFLWLAKQCHGAKILAVMPTPSYSHQSVFKVYIESLAERGHTIVIIKPTTRVFYDDRFSDNITEIDATMSEFYFSELFTNASVFRKRGIVADSKTVTSANYLGLVHMISNQFKLPAVKQLIEHRHRLQFDVLITEAFIDYPLVFSYLFGDLPIIQISSGHGVAENFETMGAVSRHPLYYPNMWRDRFTNLNVWETINEIYMEMRLQNEFSLLAEEQNKLLAHQFGIGVPTVQKLRDRVQLLLVNTHAVFDNNRPVPPSVQYMGGLHLHKKTIKPMSNYVQNFLDNSTRGVVYVSFGSSITSKNMAPEFLSMIIETFKLVPYDIAWKFDIVPEVNNLPENVLIQDWYDQYSVLHHVNVKVFVTQGGVQSTDEAIDALVPLVGVPMMGDQFFHTNKYAELSIGCAVDTLTVNSLQLMRAIVDAATSAKYRNGLRHLRQIINHQPMTPLHKAIWYTEHVIRHGKNDNTWLKTKAANVGYSDYFMMYILFPLVSVTAMNQLQQLMRLTFFSM
ncbi:EGT [Buzura suppressaria nucleopolyhedrovirus]|uniref:Ecdysteroid UDP-glucosyltransferase n=1 Tax=Buzura suppressaria nuclear polyhedrosis virus TaxID=74320 RepID=O11454_NPVBS|nr:EGT [Buzura suppressaria nucleopolyhedrovirus]AAB58353.1 ecdysteroid UDP-glucosyltransferase [Buzura suppressaria nucleopolyhedrovirus]AHH82713.1 EGT [Buzura suppressaria nucleopolyhedrovirus]AKN91097.1 EGT [Buzura suppressaria nucleopolyhedrovirus]